MRERADQFIADDAVENKGGESMSICLAVRKTLDC